MGYVTVLAKILKELHIKLRKYSVPVSDAIRLTREVKIKKPEDIIKA